MAYVGCSVLVATLFLHLGLGLTIREQALLWPELFGAAAVRYFLPALGFLALAGAGLRRTFRGDPAAWALAAASTC